MSLNLLASSALLAGLSVVEDLRSAELERGAMLSSDVLVKQRCQEGGGRHCTEMMVFFQDLGIVQLKREDRLLDYILRLDWGGRSQSRGLGVEADSIWSPTFGA